MPLLLVAPLLIYMLVFYALPVISMLLRSVNERTWTLANYAALADDPVFLKTFSITLNTAFIVTLATLVLGYPMALGLVSMKERVRLVNGTIEIQSRPNEGTTLKVRIPL